MSLALDPGPVRPITLTRRTLAAVCLTAGLAAGYLLADTDPATIGGTAVPAGLACSEDETISFDMTAPAPRPLACVHFERIDR